MASSSPRAPLGQADLDQLYLCLQGALSSDVAAQKRAEAALADLSTAAGFCSCLVGLKGCLNFALAQEIIRKAEADHSARWLASVQLKNTVAKLWRTKRDTSGISQDEKHHLRQSLLTMIGQEDDKIALQMALIFGKVARIDFPSQWPDLISCLMAALRTGNPLLSRRTYLILHYVLKELSSKRLPADQKLFAEVTLELFAPLWKEWCQSSTGIVENLPQAMAQPHDCQGLLAVFENWLHLLKVVHLFLTFGHGSDARALEVVPVVCTAAPTLLQVLQSLMANKPKQPASDNQLHSVLAKGVAKVAKLLTALQEVHPWSLADSGALLGSLKFFVSHLIEAEARGEPLFERHLVQASKFIVNSLQCKSYKGSSQGLASSDKCKTQGDRLKGMASQVQQPLQSFWRDAHAQALCEALVHKYFVLTAADLEKWASSPEDFYHGNDGGNTSENLRGSMELLFSVLLRTYREQLAPVVAQMLHSAPAVSSALEPVLVREAIYAAVCIGSSDLYDYVDFGSWFRTALMQELGDTTPAHSPLRRRAALVVSSWVSKLSEGDRVLAYKLLVELLAEADMCLKLSAVKSLRELIDDWDFKEKAFEPFVSPCLELLCAALRSSEELDTHIQVFSLFNLIIERMLGDIKQLAPSLAQLLPHIWEQAQEQNLLRMQVLIAYQHLINALGADSPSTYQWVIPMISHSVNVDHPDSLNLMEDGLELLLVALRNAPMHTGEPLLEVVQQLGKILERSAEMVPLLMRIMSSCILLGGASLLTRYGSALSAMLCSLIGNVRDSAYHLICRVLEIALKVAPTEALQAFEDPIRQLLGVLMSMSREGSFDSLVFAQGCVVFGRVLLMDVQYFWQFFQKSAQSGMFGDADGAKLMMGFVDLWMDQFDALPSEAARKLCALALCNLLTIPCPQVLGQLGPILACITAVCHELEGGVLPQRQVDASGDRSYGFANESMMHEQLGVAAIGSEDAQPEVDRKREVYTADPSNSLKVSQYFKQKLAEAGSVHGATFNAAVSSVHPTLVEQVKSIVGT